MGHIELIAGELLVQQGADTADGDLRDLPVVVGDRRPYLTCLVMIDQENVEKFAQDRAVPFTNYASLCRARQVQDLIWGEIEKVNADFARWQARATAITKELDRLPKE